MSLLLYQFLYLSEAFIFDGNHQIIILFMREAYKLPLYFILRESHKRPLMDYTVWIDKYNEIVFFQLFRMKTKTFKALLNEILDRDVSNIIRNKYTGGRYPVEPEKSLLVFLRYISSQETLLSIGDRFNIVSSTVMNLVNAFLYVVIGMKSKWIQCPKTPEDFEFIKNGFINYPGTIGSVDGCHIKIKVLDSQQDSYIDRFQTHSINLMGICTASKIFSYVFIGYPGSAHDSRVFSNSILVRQIEMFGKQKYFPSEEVHIIGDSAFPLKTWLMKPYPQTNQITAVQRYHNKKLSSDRVCIENTFGILKLRWARLKYINTYCIAKAIEITTAACILHNYCYLQNDEWDEIINNIPDNQCNQEDHGNVPDIYALARQKRNEICNELWTQRPIQK